QHERAMRENLRILLFAATVWASASAWAIAGRRWRCWIMPGQSSQLRFHITALQAAGRFTQAKICSKWTCGQEFEATMKDQCPKTCNLCSSQPAPGPSPGVPSPGLPSGPCEDKFQACRVWIKSNFCQWP
ncbi:hypothetical protein AAVH_32783, partial [Aphelenchoides avenae]